MIARLDLQRGYHRLWDPQQGLVMQCIRIVLRVGVMAAALWTPAAAQDINTVYDMAERAAALQRSGRLKEALPLYEEALRLAPQTPGVERIDVLYYNSALVYMGLGNQAKARVLFEAALNYRDRTLGADHPETLRVLESLVSFHSNVRDGDSAQALSKRLVELSTRRYGSDSVEYAKALGIRAMVVSVYGDPNNERPGLLQKIVQIREARLGPNDASLSDPLMLQAQALANRGRFEEADTLWRRIEGLSRFEARNSVHAMSHRRVQLASLVYYYQQTGRYLDAEAAGLKSLALSRKMSESLPSLDDGLPGQMSSLGETYLLMGLPEKAAAEYEQALAMIKVLPNPPNAGMCLGGLARAKQLLGKLEESEILYKAAIEEGQTQYNMSLVRLNLGSLYRQRKEFGKARDLMQGAYANLEKEFGSASPFLVTVRLAIADLDLVQGKPAEALAGYSTLVKSLEERYGDTHPNLAEAQLGLARVYAQTNQQKTSIDSAHLARRNLRRYVRRVLPALAENEQLQFLQTQDGPSLAQALELALPHRDQPDVIDRSLSWILNAKGVAQEAIAQRTLLARDTRDPRLTPILREWLMIRYRLAKLTLADPTSASNEDQRRVELESLIARERELGGRLGRAAAEIDEADPWVETELIRKNVPADGVLVEIARVGGELGERYLAWVVPPAGQGEIRLVELGSAAEMDAAVAAARKPLVEASSLIKELGEKEAELALQKPLALLADKLLRPLELTKYSRWILCPDGSTWLVPWAALPIETGKYAVEKHTISYVVSGRDLAAFPRQTVSGNPGLVLADPDFDFSDTTERKNPQEARGGLGNSRGDDLQTRQARRSALRSAVSSRWERLPGTAQEAEILKPKLIEYLGSELDLRTGQHAVEQVIRDAWQPRVAVLSTHGYFVEAPAGKPLPLALRNPLIRCGLALAGANRRSTGEANQPDDGILTGLEIVGADFRDTELVVLSACETGLGEVHSGEGVAGLRQAFQLAGAQSVLATLWRIPDADTAKLMSVFYGELVHQGDKAVALRAAQWRLLDEHRKGPDRSGHPFFWAAFGLTGGWRKPQVRPPTERPKMEPVKIRVEVVAAPAQVMDGANMLAQIGAGQKLEVAGERGEWWLVDVPGQARRGWILKRQVREIADW